MVGPLGTDAGNAVSSHREGTFKNASPVFPRDKEILLVNCPQVDVVARTDKLVNLGFTSAKESRGAWNVKEFGDIL